jgi:hypothetical protein
MKSRDTPIKIEKIIPTSSLSNTRYGIFLTCTKSIHAMVYENALENYEMKKKTCIQKQCLI